MATERNSDPTLHKQLTPFKELEAFHRRLKRWRLTPAAATMHAQTTRASLRALLHLGDAVYSTNGEAKRKLRAVRRWLCRVAILIEDMADEKQVPALELVNAMRTLKGLSQALDELDCRPVSEWLETQDWSADQEKIFSFDMDAAPIVVPDELALRGCADPPHTGLADHASDSYDSPPG